MTLFDSSSDQIREASFSGSEEEQAEPIDFRQLGIDKPVPEAGLGHQEASSFIEEVEPNEDSLDDQRWNQAYDRGRAEAEASIQKLREQHEEQLQQTMSDVLDQVAALERAVDARVREVSVMLGRAFAEHILERELHEHDAILDISAAAIQRASGIGKITLTVHPDAVPLLEEKLETLRRLHPDGSGIELESDVSLEYGDVRLVAEGGTIESILEDRMGRLVRKVSQEAESVPGVGLGDEPTDPPEEGP